MTRTSLTLPHELAQALDRETKRRSTSASAVAREAIANHLGFGDATPRQLPFAGIDHSRRAHTARDAEKILARQWGRSLTRDPSTPHWISMMPIKPVACRRCLRPGCA